MSIQKEVLDQRLLALFTNDEVVAKLSDAKNPEECYKIAKNYVPDVSFDEFTQSMALIHEYLEENQDGFIELDDLDNVAGGSATSVINAVAKVVAAAAPAVIPAVAAIT